MTDGGAQWRLTATDWSRDVLAPFRDIYFCDIDGLNVVQDGYSSTEVEFVQHILEPVAFRLAEQDDWLELFDAKILTGDLITQSAGALMLLNALHPHHPTVKAEGHDERVAMARKDLPVQWQRHVTPEMERFMRVLAPPTQ